MSPTDPFDLARFRTAQQSIFASALAELHAGRKQTHWMWFVFPQLRGLGHSPTARFYGISSIEEARAYLDDPVLGERLRRATAATLAIGNLSARDVFGSPDDMKFRSSMTLFAVAAPKDARAPYQAALDRYFDGMPDPRMLERLSA